MATEAATYHPEECQQAAASLLIASTLCAMSVPAKPVAAESDRYSMLLLVATP